MGVRPSSRSVSVIAGYCRKVTLQAFAVPPLTLTSAQIGFKFDGEYWNDELRSYRVSIPSRCIEEGAQ